MKKKVILSTLLIYLNTSLIIPTTLNADSYLDQVKAKWKDYQSEMVDEKYHAEISEPVTFDSLYPIPFYKTGAFKWSSIVVVSLAAAALTVPSGGASDVWGATYIGGLLGSTWTAGLATLGGGTLASGGFGMAGGAFVIASTTDIAISSAFELVIPDNNLEGQNYSYIKVPLPKVGSENVLKIYTDIDELMDSFEDDDISEEIYKKQMSNLYLRAIDEIDATKSGYDLINGAILTYNLGLYEKSQKYLTSAKNLFPTSSYIFYHQALLFLVNSDINEAINNLIFASEKEPEYLTPYLLLTQIAIDENDYELAIKTALNGLENYDDENFQLNYLAGMIYFKKRDFALAAKYFREALSNTTINEIEADCKLWLAICNYKLNNYNEANNWYKKAIDEVDDNEAYKNKIKNGYDKIVLESNNV